MRKILFRGETLYDGRWIEGHICENIYGQICIQELNENVVCGCVVVDPETVGQYTGLKDRNGERIFENGYMIIDKQTYKVLFDNGEYILKNIFNCDIIQLKNNSNIGVFVDEI